MIHFSTIVKIQLVLVIWETNHESGDVATDDSSRDLNLCDAIDIPYDRSSVNGDCQWKIGR